MGIFDNNNVTIFAIKDGIVERLNKDTIKPLLTQEQECEICQQVIMFLCAQGAGIWIRCVEICAPFCILTFKHPIAIGICIVICTAACRYGIGTLCGYTAKEACERLGYC